AITTDASSLYPQPIAQVFGAVPHQLCEFHALKELTKAVLRAVAQLRKRLAAQKPPLPRGRPSTRAAQRAARRRQRLRQKVGDLFGHRPLFVGRHLTAAERATLQRITRGQRQLRPLRAIVDEVYRLFDRRCRTDTALAKLARLRRRVRRLAQVRRALNKLFSPHLEKALTLLDDPLLPSTSNPAERGNLPPPPRWSAAIDAIARCRRRSIGCAPGSTSAPASPWTCSVTPANKGARKPRPPSTRPGQDSSR